MVVSVVVVGVCVPPSLDYEKFVQFSDLDRFTLLFSAAVHDLRHPGVNNAFLASTLHPVAVRYNDKSVSLCVCVVVVAGILIVATNRACTNERVS